jgi:hypothetical protein
VTTTRLIPDLAFMPVSDRDRANARRPTMSDQTIEEIKVSGEQLLAKVRELIRQGNIRRITITDKDGKVLMSFPLTIGVVGALLAPTLAAIGAIAALVTECTVKVEREVQP